MALYKRKPGGPWWTRFAIGGRTIRKSTGTTDKAKADEYEQALRDRYWRKIRLGENIHTWREAVQRYKREAVWRPHTKLVNDRALKFFEHIEQIPVAAITVEVVGAARQYVERTQKAASANRIMAVFRGVLKACVKWGWLAYAPPVPMTHVTPPDPRWITGEQVATLIKWLPEHLRAAVIFSVLTGLRDANTRALKWSQVDLELGFAWIPSSHYKAKRTHGVSLPPEAIQVLQRVPRVSEYVFTFKGRRIKTRLNNTAFRKARKRAGLAKLRWHDLRHTFASWLAQKGYSGPTIQAMGGWQDGKMVERYAHLNPENTRPFAAALGTNVVTAMEEIWKPRVLEMPEKQVVPSHGIEPWTPSLRKHRFRKGRKDNQ